MDPSQFEDVTDQFDAYGRPRVPGQAPNPVPVYRPKQFIDPRFEEVDISTPEGYRGAVPPAQHEAPTTLESFGHGANTIYEGAKQWVRSITDGHGVDPQVNADLETYTSARNAAFGQAGEEPGFDFGSAAGAGAVTAPLGMVKMPSSLLGMTAASSGLGAAAAAVPYTPEGALSAEKAVNTAVGAGFGAGVPLAGKAIGKGVRTAWGGATSIGNAIRSQLSGKTTFESVSAALRAEGQTMATLPEGLKASIMREAKRQMATNGSVDAESLARKAQLAKAGFTGEAAPTRGQLLRDGGDWGLERNLAKGDDGVGLATRFANQQAQFTKLIGDVGDSLSKTAFSTYHAGNMLKRAVSVKSREMQKAVSELYDGVRKKHGDSFAIQPKKLMDMMENEVIDDPALNDLSGAVTNRLRRYGVLDADGSVVGPMTAKQAEDLRKWIGGRPGNDGTIKRIRGMLVDALDNDVVDHAGEDVFGVARNAAKERFIEFERIQDLAGMGGKDIDPEKVLKSYFQSGSIDDLTALKESLVTGSAEQVERGTRAWDAIRRRLWDTLMEGVMDAKGQVTDHKLNKALARIKDERLDILFDDVAGDISTIADASKLLLRQPAFSTENFSGTSPALTQMLTRLIPGARDAMDLTREAARGSMVQNALAGSTARSPASVPGDASRIQEIARALSFAPIAPAAQATGQSLPIRKGQ